LLISSNWFIAALAHDIGKIKNPKMLKSVGFDDVIVKDMHHMDLSIEYFKSFVKNLGFYEENEIVIKAIQEHHSSTLPTAKLSKLLFTSDKEARKLESNELISKLKEEAEEKIKKYEREQQEKVNNEQIELLKKQLAEKDELIQNMNQSATIEEKKEDVTETVITETVTKEEYEQAKIIKESKVEVVQNEDNTFDELIAEIKNSANSCTEKGNDFLIKELDLLDNVKEFLKSISDDNYLYFTYYGLREVFSKVENKKISFEEMKTHKYFELLKEQHRLEQMEFEHQL
jgi:hypothetical protein